MNKKLIVGNWKMNSTFSTTKEFLKEFQSLYSLNSKTYNQKAIFAVATPFTNLAALKDNDLNLKLVAQNMSFYEKGAYTGEVSADMLLDLNVSYVILGHSEQRQYHAETDENVNKKARLALEKNLTPIVCVGETLEEYLAGKTKEVVKAQLAASLKDLDVTKVIVAYEPIWAIGTGKVATAQIAQDVCKYIKELTSKQTVVQYGGSVNAKNIFDLSSQEDIDGFLVGGASLKATDFSDLMLNLK
ncbi:triose-phosphate isomerase [Mycoplasmopsis synoviae]|uniref:triose-phosphate isomerase n=1 Tax=Mycoplasmopsis synoviae TaxID=2109 RepID=UPI001CE226C4|nr:triose-phosphate isomerase [Mycoplasmopsis synoviae]UBX98484.1 triose-phosphate isomerase [Mycoplasmopsis synoviae]